MKCPECGYVSFSGLRECKKCGHPFAQSGEAGSPRSPIPISHERSTRTSPSAPPEPDATLHFDFEGDCEEGSHTGGSAKIAPGHASAGRSKTDNILDRAFEDRTTRGKKPDLESIPLNRTVRPIVNQPASLTNRPERTNFIGSPRSQPVIVEFASTPLNASRVQANLDEIPVAPLGRRFLAGVVDALILLAAGGVFAGLFTAARGRFETQPLDLAVAGFIALFWIFFYFGLFTALALRTPGQAAMGLTVRNLDGDLPTRQETLLRAFGYLISIVALMVGFLWAAMDSDGMAWHDHISGTLLVEERGTRAEASL